MSYDASTSSIKRFKKKREKAIMLQNARYSMKAGVKEFAVLFNSKTLDHDRTKLMGVMIHVTSL